VSVSAAELFEWNKLIGLNIHGARVSTGMTQEELAGTIGLSQAQVNRLEHGRQGFRSQTLERIAKALGTTPWRLLMSVEERHRFDRSREETK